MPKLFLRSTWIAQQYSVSFFMEGSSTPEAEANRKITVGTDMIMNARI